MSQSYKQMLGIFLVLTSLLFPSVSRAQSIDLQPIQYYDFGSGSVDLANSSGGYFGFSPMQSEHVTASYIS